MQGQGSVVPLLLSAGALVDIRCKDGETPLMRAAFNGHTGAMELLLSAGCGVFESRLLKVGGLRRHPSPVAVSGADINAKSKQHGNTALIIAASRLHRVAVLRLLSGGASVNAATNVRL